MDIRNSNYNSLFTANECLIILRNALKCDDHLKIDLINFKLIPVSDPEILGLLGEYFQLYIDATIGNALQSEKFEYFVKSVPVTNAIQTKIVLKSDVFSKETILYTNLFKELDKYRTSKWKPDCYYVRQDIIVMEDLRKQKYRHLPEKEEFSLKHIKIALEKLSSMHANSIIFEDRTGVNIGEKYEHDLREIAIITDFGWFKAGIKAVQSVAKKIPKFHKVEIQKFISNDFMKCTDRMIEIVQTSKNHRNVFCHGDLWVKNLLFKYDDNTNYIHPIDCILIDFQIARYIPPALDVLQLIYLNTNRKLRNAHMDELLQFYYECLRKCLKTVDINVEKHLTWDEFLRSCKDLKLLPLVLSGMYTQLSNLPEGFLNNFMKKDPQGYKLCLNDGNVRSDFVFEHMKENEMYRELILEYTEEIIEYAMEIV